MIDFFSPDYSTARDRFRTATLSNGGHVESILLNAKGPDGGDLTVDIGWFGDPGPRRALIHSSGLHGVEGFAGSAVQLQWLEQGIPNLPPDSAIVLVHAMNPFGMAWLRRANENNVDLNRNFLSADEEYSGAPEKYAQLDSWLNPESPPSSEFFRVQAWFHALRCGPSSFRRALTAGQYDFPRGLSFGGKQHVQTTRRFQLYISGRLAWADRLVAIDVHTGPGKFGVDRLFVDGEGDRAANAAEMQLAYGDPVQQVDESQTRGSLDQLYRRMFPAAKLLFTAQKFGSCSELEALAALRAENRQHHFGNPGIDEPAKAQLLKTFCPVNERWRETILARGQEVIEQAATLAFEPPTQSGTPAAFER